MLYVPFLHHDCTTFRRFLLELSHHIGQDELVRMEVLRRLRERRVTVHLLEPVQLPASLKQTNPALVTEIMKVQVIRSFARDWEDRALLFPFRLHSGS